MEKDISEIDKNLWNKVKNTTKKLNKEISYIKKPLQNITKKQNRNSISNNSTIQDSRNNEKNYDLIEKKIIQQHHPKNLSDFTNIKTGVDKKTINKIKKGSFTINAKLDLHGCRLNEAEKLLKIFILEKFSKNEQNLLIISGKGKNGKGVIKSSIPNWLEKPPLSEKVYVFSKAQNKDGGEGAYFVRLRKK